MKKLLILAVLISAGCTSTYVTHNTYYPPAGYDAVTELKESFVPASLRVTQVGPLKSTLSIHRRTCISKVEMPTVEFLPDGTSKMTGYQNDGGNGVVAGAVEAACKGAVKGAVGK